MAIFLGGGLGSVARYGVSLWLGKTENGFPLGTLAANVLACLVLGFLATWLERRSGLDSQVAKMLMVGFCGGFSTFSTFSNETATLFQEGKLFLGGLYIGLSVLVCVLGILGGNVLGKWV